MVMRDMEKGWSNKIPLPGLGDTFNSRLYKRWPCIVASSKSGAQLWEPKTSKFRKLKVAVTTSTVKERVIKFPFLDWRKNSGACGGRKESVMRAGSDCQITGSRPNCRISQDPSSYMNSAGQPEGHLETWRLEKRDKSGGPEIALGCARWFGFKMTKPGSNQNRTTTCGSHQPRQKLVLLEGGWVCASCD